MAAKVRTVNYVRVAGDGTPTSETTAWVTVQKSSVLDLARKEVPREPSDAEIIATVPELIRRNGALFG